MSEVAKYTATVLTNEADGTSIALAEGHFNVVMRCDYDAETARADKAEADRDAATEAFRTTVRLTKSGIRERIEAALSAAEPPSVRAALESVLHRLAEALQGERYDNSWIRPLRLSIKERQDLYLACVEEAKAALAACEQPVVDEVVTCVKANPKVYEFRDEPDSVVRSYIFFELCPTELKFNEGDRLRIVGYRVVTKEER